MRHIFYIVEWKFYLIKFGLRAWCGQGWSTLPYFLPKIVPEVVDLRVTVYLNRVARTFFFHALCLSELKWIVLICLVSPLNISLLLYSSWYVVKHI
jgi:hypothetical protein